MPGEHPAGLSNLFFYSLHPMIIGSFGGQAYTRGDALRLWPVERIVVGGQMRTLATIFVLSALSVAQTAGASQASPVAGSSKGTGTKAGVVSIPAGTKVPLALKQAISTRSAKEGDAVYCET